MRDVILVGVLVSVFGSACNARNGPVDVVASTDSTDLVMLFDSTLGVIFKRPVAYGNFRDSSRTSAGTRMMLGTGAGRAAEFRAVSIAEVVRFEREFEHWWEACRSKPSRCTIDAPQVRRLRDYRRQYIGYTDSLDTAKMLIVIIHRDMESQIRYWRTEPVVLDMWAGDEYMVFDFLAAADSIGLKYGVTNGR